MAKVSTTTTVIKTPEGRASFASVFEKASYGDAKPAYEITLLFPKGTDISALKVAASNAAINKWGDKVVAIKPRSPLRDGDGVKQNGASFPEEYKGHWFVKFKSYNKPGVVDRKGLKPLEDESEFYSGCWCKVSAVPYAYGGPGTTYTPGVSFWLNNILKTRDDDPFSGRVSADDEFAEDNVAGDDSEVSSQGTVEDIFS